MIPIIATHGIIRGEINPNDIRFNRKPSIAFLLNVGVVAKLPTHCGALREHNCGAVLRAHSRVPLRRLLRRRRQPTREKGLHERHKELLDAAGERRLRVSEWNDVPGGQLSFLDRHSRRLL